MSELAIETNGLVKQYSNIRAVDGLNMAVPRGSVYGLLGRNGAGKTTTIRMLLGLARPSDGSARVLDMTWPRDGLSILRRTAFVAEKKILFDSMTGRELVHFNRGFFGTWSDALAAKCARRLEIPMTVPFKNLSQGNRTKLCLLLALAQGSELLILDEPTVGVDPVTIDEILNLLIEDYAGEAHTIFLSSHQLPEVERMADWVGIIDNGKLVLEARLDDMRVEFRRVTVFGNALPSSLDEQVISAISRGSISEYIVKNRVDRFVANLRAHGATIVEISSLSLNEIFLQIVRKEEPCTSGNAGETPAPLSSSI